MISIQTSEKAYFERVKEMCDFWKNKSIELHNELQHYKDLEEQGRLIEQEHGRWICLEAEIGLYECSKCGHKILRNKTNYCPNCGCKTEELPKLAELKGTDNGMD